MEQSNGPQNNCAKEMNYRGLSSDEDDTLADMHRSMNSDCQDYPRNMKCDFRHLSHLALKRYCILHQIKCSPHTSQEKMSLLVAQHFKHILYRQDEEYSITTFMSHVRGEKRPTLRPIQIPSIQSDARAKTKSTKTYPGTGENKPMHALAEPRNEQPLMDSLRPEVQVGTENQQYAPPNGSTYCICNQSNTEGKMIACDNRQCPEPENWYHWTCVEINVSDIAPKVWFCPPCQRYFAHQLSLVASEHQLPGSGKAKNLTYGQMITRVLQLLPELQGTFHEICFIIQMNYSSQLNWKMESESRSTPVWVSSVRKILYSSEQFQRSRVDKDLFQLQLY